MNNPYDTMPTTPQTHENMIIKSIIDFVYNGLVTWQREYKKNNEHNDEDHLNANLCKFLTSNASAESVFLFNHEEPQTGQCRIDISSYDAMEYNRIYTVFECKRLPTPSKAREKEYLTGGEKVSGGIQRFKLEKHGKDFKIAGMIGYIQEHDAPHFHNQINTWINDLTSETDDGLEWSAEECLQYERKKEKTYHCISKHKRQSKAYITLHHLWIDME